MHRFTTRRLLVALLTWAVANFAAAEAFKSLEPNVLYEATPEKSEKAIIYETVGLSGEHMLIEVRSKTNVEVTVHTFRGEPMLSRSGQGTITLEIVLPLDDVYFVSVLREDAANTFTIRRSRKGDLPDLYMAFFADGVGFRNEVYSSCWIEPGLHKKIIMVDKDSKNLGHVGQGMEYEEVFLHSGEVSSNVRRRRIISDDKSIVTMRNNGKIITEFEQNRSQWKTEYLKKYWRYLCE